MPIQGILRCVLCAAILAKVLALPVQDAQPVPSFIINLDLPPEKRFDQVVAHFNGTLQKLWTDLVSKKIVLALAEKISNARGPENDELMGEIRGIAKASGFPVSVIHAAQLLYEVNTLMVPIVNISWPWGKETEFGPDVMAPRFGCTGIIARDKTDGTVYHARNLDFSFAEYLSKMTYNGVFTSSGQELFTSQMIAMYQSPLTGIRRGKNGWSFEVNTRFLDHKGGNEELLKLVFKEKRTTSGWVKRKVLENVTDFEDAVDALSNMPYAATEYNIMSGVQKGSILARNPDGLAYKLDLNHKPYIIMTNFDYVYHDIREFFDPTSVKGIGHPRRIDAEKILNASNAITPEVLYTALNDPGVMAKDTIFQAVINVEKDSYTSFLPPCQKCN